MEGIGQKKEADYIFDKTIKCDVCGKEFKTKQIRTGKARFIGTDDILKPLYEGVDTCKYDIIMCPHCGFAFRRNENTSLVHPRESKQCSSGKHIQQNCVKDQHANAFQHLINLGLLQRSRKQKLTAMREL